MRRHRSRLPEQRSSEISRLACSTTFYQQWYGIACRLFLHSVVLSASSIHEACTARTTQLQRYQYLRHLRQGIPRDPEVAALLHITHLLSHQCSISRTMYLSQARYPRRLLHRLSVTRLRRVSTGSMLGTVCTMSRSFPSVGFDGT
jgi:hypothetical protein